MKYDSLIEEASQKTRPKIVFVLPSMSAGGAERVLITLMNRLDKTRYAPEFITLNRKGPLRDWVDADIPYHCLGRSKKMILGLPKLVWELHKIKPDIVISTMATMNFGLLLARPFLPRNTRIIVREAIVPSFICENVRKGWIAKYLYQWLYPHADLVISPAQAIIDEFQNYLGMRTDNHVLLRNPVDNERIRAMPQILQNVTEERKNTVHFLCAGRLHPQKGFDRLIKALPWMNHELDWHLTILGGGKERSALETLIEEHSLQDKVSLPGFTNTPWQHIGAADCFLLPSRWEGLPNVVLESLSVGTPVIAMREAGGIDEIAQLSPDDSIRVVDTTPNFVDAMQDVRPQPTRLFRPSMLPPSFQIQVVMDQFMDLLGGKKEAITAPSKRQKTKAGKQRAA